MGAVVQPDNKVIDHLTVKCHEVDSAKRLKPASFMDMAQEIAYQAASAMHFGYDELIVNGMAWVLSRMHFRFVDAPMWRDELEIRTWHRGSSGPFFIRDFEIVGSDGSRKVEATSSWVVIDTVSRRMTRPEDVLPKENTACSDFAIESPSSKVIMPRGRTAEFAGTHKVGYSDIDLVGHTNNARYVAWAMDCLDWRQEVDEVEITFHHEAVGGDVVSLYRLDEGNSSFIEGIAGSTQIFCTRISRMEK